MVTLHIIACIILVLSVLLQQGKGAEVGAVFGSSEAVFGSSGPASLLSKITTAVAVVFMVTSLSLTYLAAHDDGGSVMKEVAPVSKTAPVAPVPLSEPAGQGKELPQGHLSVNVQQPAPAGDKKKAEPVTPDDSKGAGEHDKTGDSQGTGK